MATASSERRLFERFSAKFPTRFRDISFNYGQDVFLQDFSASGAHFVSRERMYIDDVVSLDVKMPDDLDPVVLNGRVRWARQDAMNLWDVGIEFHKVNLMRLHRLMRYSEDAAISG